MEEAIQNVGPRLDRVATSIAGRQQIATRRKDKRTIHASHAQHCQIAPQGQYHLPPRTRKRNMRGNTAGWNKGKQAQCRPKGQSTQLGGLVRCSKRDELQSSRYETCIRDTCQTACAIDAGTSGSTPVGFRYRIRQISDMGKSLVS